MQQPRSRYIDLNGQRRHILEWGNPGKPVALLQHGMRDHAHSWVWLASHLAENYFIIAPDLRGHGDSDWSPDGNYALSSYVIDLAEIVDIYSLKQFSLIGHSLGGQIALRYAGIFPERVKSLLVIEGVELPLIRREREAPCPHPQRMREWIDEELMRRLRTTRYYSTLQDAERRMAQANPDIDDDTIAYLAKNGIIEEAGRGLRWKFDNACRFRAPDDQRGTDLEEILEAIVCPTILAYGEESWIEPPPTNRLARLKNHRVIRFARASHWLHHQRRHEFCELAQNFISDPQFSMSNESSRYA